MTPIPSMFATLPKTKQVKENYAERQHGRRNSTVFCQYVKKRGTALPSEYPTADIAPHQSRDRKRSAHSPIGHSTDSPVRKSLI